MSRNRLLITQSLLSSWSYLYQPMPPGLSEEQKNKIQEGRKTSFLQTLNREKTKPSKAMLSGIQFENMVKAYCEGNEPAEDHKWRNGIIGAGDIVKGGQFQVAAYRDAQIDGIPFLLYGRLDGLKAGVIYDIKFSKAYQPGKYLDSPQHPMYFACVPEAKRFDYIVYTGKEVCTESYSPQDTEPIERTIHHFIRYLEVTGLDKAYIEKWRAK